MGNHRTKRVLTIVQSVLWLIIGIGIGMVLGSDMGGKSKVLILTVSFVIVIGLIVLFTFIVSKELWSYPENYVKKAQKVTPMDNSAAQISSAKRGEVKYQSTQNQNNQAKISRNFGIGQQREEKQQDIKQHIKKVVLINEEGQALKEWNVSGKSGLVIGKSIDKESVEIDLSDSAYAKMISKQHAVLNFTGDKWCVDDIDSKNGTRVKKLNQNAILDLKLVGSVEVEPGDIIYIANTMLQLR